MASRNLILLSIKAGFYPLIVDDKNFSSTPTQMAGWLLTAGLTLFLFFVISNMSIKIIKNVSYAVISLLFLLLITVFAEMVTI